MNNILERNGRHCYQGSLEILLDFDGIDDIGQGFAHELFVVFKRKHPHVNLNVTNENQDVRKMIAHVNAGN